MSKDKNLNKVSAELNLSSEKHNKQNNGLQDGKVVNKNGTLSIDNSNSTFNISNKDYKELYLDEREKNAKLQKQIINLENKLKKIKGFKYTKTLFLSMKQSLYIDNLLNRKNQDVEIIQNVDGNRGLVKLNIKTDEANEVIIFLIKKWFLDELNV